jgi:biotin carboxyl carrier protein
MVAPRIDSTAVSYKIVTIGGRQVEIEVEETGQILRWGEQEIELLSLSNDEAEIRFDGRVRVVPYALTGSTLSFAYEGEIYFAEVNDKGGRAKVRHRDHSTEAPMPGVVLKILVRPGDVVTRGMPMLILEAMKMEHPIVAPRDGSIASVNCTEGELVQPGLELVTLSEP